MANFESYLKENQNRFEQDLCEWLRMPSISTDSAYQEQVRQAASWLHNRIDNLGFQTELIETCGHPIVYGESPAIPNAPTVLVYGHYDVQPPDPLDEWETPPFEPSIRNGNVYARGATDDKGQMITHLFSVEAWKKTMGDLPIQIKFLIEGEEECGSGGLYEFLAGKYDQDQSVTEKLAADIAVISDCSQYGPGMPAITYGLRGICYFELLLRGPSQDLHSGAFGGSVTNPANALARMLSALIDEQGRIQIPGFYDDVIPLTDVERKQFADLDFDNGAYMKQLDVDDLSGEIGYSTLERRWARPTFDINGMWSGYQGEGAKTVLPAHAGAKFSFRLVPNQDVAKITDNLRDLLAQVCPPGIRMELVEHHGAPGFVLPLENPFMQAASNAIEQGFGTKPVMVRSGGSIPVVNSFSSQLNIDTLLLGWGQDDDNPHSPNEKFSLADFHKGIRSSAHLWQEIGKLSN
ncbi:MAG: dipeptidase [Planctomycetota bacterium]|nr:dipeptidase [Planctomycetota bacterium]